MTLIHRIEKKLSENGHDMPSLAKYLHLPEQVLFETLENQTIELRYLEAIAKILKLPLYSLFNDDEDLTISHYLKPLDELLDSANDHNKSPQKIQEEIKMLEEAIERKRVVLSVWK
ncbi:MAG: hypothetical protein JST26_04820 [Bacteroidetes bacterium]|nr:hypothetical protein [Bacteroidota bacterium]